MLSKEEIEAFGVNALDDILQITDHILLPEGRMDCVIVAVAHNKFKRMNLKDFLLAQTFSYEEKLYQKNYTFLAQVLSFKL